MSRMTEILKRMGARFDDYPCTCSFKHWGPCLHPELLMERGDTEMWVPIAQEEQYAADGWTPVQLGAPLIATRINPDGSRDTVAVSYEREGAVVSTNYGKRR